MKQVKVTLMLFLKCLIAFINRNIIKDTNILYIIVIMNSNPNKQIFSQVMLFVKLVRNDLSQDIEILYFLFLGHLIVIK